MLDYEEELKLKFHSKVKEEILMQEFLHEEIEENDDLGLEIIDMSRQVSAPLRKESELPKEEAVNWIKGRSGF